MSGYTFTDKDIYPNAYWAGFPKAYGSRDGYLIKLAAVHYTAGSETRSSAENGVAYDKVRTDGTSCHVFHDPDSSAQEVPRSLRANSAFYESNRIANHHELCGTAQTRAQWQDANSDAILWRASESIAHDCLDFGLQPRRLTVPQVRACWTNNKTAVGGMCGHVDITLAFPGPGRNHDDPGINFPWDILETRTRYMMEQIHGASVPITRRRKMFVISINVGGDVQYWATDGLGNRKQIGIPPFGWSDVEFHKALSGTDIVVAKDQRDFDHKCGVVQPI